MTPEEESIKRTSAIENIAASVENRMNLSMLKWSTNIQESLIKVSVHKSVLDETVKEFRTVANAFLRMIDEFKNCATQEEYSKIKKRVDDWNPETYITKREFIKMLKARLL